MKIIVADSSALILLTKSGLLNALLRRFPVTIPEAVLNEVVNEATLNRFPDAKAVSDMVAQRKITVAKVDLSSVKLPFTMGLGETEALILAKQAGGSILATDDGKAIRACRYLAVPFIISPRIATELYRMKAIELGQARSAIEKMKIVGRYTPDIIAEAMLELEVIKNAKTDNR